MNEYVSEWIHEWWMESNLLPQLSCASLNPMDLDRKD